MRSLVVFASLLMAAVAPAFAGNFSNLYFFGDSLTDTGNVTEVYATLPRAPGAPAVIPGPPYDAEGRASNGLLYADVLAAGLGLNATASSRGGGNYAFGGARTRYQLFGAPYLGVLDQVAQFEALPGPADPAALYVVWAGSNNVQDILTGKTVDALGKPVPGVAGTLADIGSLLTGLYAEGARNLLVPNVPNLVRVPRLNSLSAAAQAQASGLINAFNSNLDGMLDQLQASHAGMNIIRFNSYNAFEDLVANAAAQGFSNITGRCYTGDDLGFTGGGTVCANPDSYLFWDGIHPTAAAHRILGLEMLAAAVPEPASWAMLGLGLLLLGQRRRAKRLVERGH